MGDTFSDSTTGDTSITLSGSNTREIKQALSDLETDA